jgi:phosphoenolpyruvate-protein phosphotransferase (PTS system enzyme I)
MKQLEGVAASQGIAVGRAHVLAAMSEGVSHHFIAQDAIDDELARFDAAIDLARTELIELRQGLQHDAPTELGAFIEVHELMLHDPALAKAPRDLIAGRRYNAAWAMSTQMGKLAEQFEEMEDEYLRERSLDVRQVGERVLKHLAGYVPASIAAGDEDMIIVAHDIAPADMLQFRQVRFAGFVTDLGGVTSHTAIVARSLQLPAVVAVGDATQQIAQDDWIIIDGHSGRITINPDEPTRAKYAKLANEERSRIAALSSLRNVPAQTPAGQLIELHANIEMPDDVEEALTANVDGIGLFRTEFMFMGRKELPDEDEQFEAYARVVKAMAGKPVTIRTLDVGADKTLDETYDTQAAVAPNPALGLRAIRYCLANPELFRVQLRAILRASAFGPVRILLPMIAHVHEVDSALAHIARVKKELRARGVGFDDKVQVGAMIEIPAAALMIDLFIPKLDFFSIGTNDLIQYTLAIDRADAEVAALYDPAHPAVMQLIAHSIARCKAAGKSISVCGEMAGDTRFTQPLLAMGLTNFSMHPGCVLPVKNVVREGAVAANSV